MIVLLLAVILSVIIIIELLMLYDIKDKHIKWH